METQQIIIFLLVIISPTYYVSASFYFGQPCSERNTAFFLSTNSRYPLNSTIKCVDITSVPNMRFTKKVFKTPKYISFLRNTSSADTLYANHMNLTKFPIFVIRNLPRLETVDLSGNMLKRIPTKMSKIAKKLDKLLLADNRINMPKRLPLMYSKSIKTLMLSNNGITELYKETFSKIPTLEVLYLDSNKIAFIEPISKVLPNLKYLHLGKNYLNSIPPKESISSSLVYYITKSQQKNERLETGSKNGTYRLR